MNRKNFVRFFTLILLSSFIFAFSAEIFAQKKPSKKAQRLAAQAGSFYNQNRFDEAIIKYAEALRISPYFPEARFFKGISHHKRGQYDLAISEFDNALKQGVDPVKVYSIRMETYAAKSDFNSAMQDAQKAINFEPQNAYYNDFLGRMYLINRDYQKGIEFLNKAVQLGSNNPNVYYFLAVGYNGIGDYLKQGDAATEALKRGTPFSGNASFLQADAFRRDKKYLKAVESYKNAINSYKTIMGNNNGNADIEENLYQSYSNLSDVYRNLNLFDDAVRTAKEGLILRPSDGNLHISLTWYYILQGERDFAVTAGKRAVQLAPNQYMAYTNLCRAYNDNGEFLHKKEAFKMATDAFNLAVSTCERALRLEPNDGETNYYLGRAYFFLDNDKLSNSYYEKSVSGLIRFTQNNPDYSDGFYLLGNAYFATGKNKEAIQAYEKCLQIAPRFAIVRYNLGYVYNQVGNKTAARQQYSLLQQLDKDLAKRLLGVLDN